MKGANIQADGMIRVRETLTEQQYVCYQEGLLAIRTIEGGERNLVEHLIQAESLGLPKAFELSSLYKYAVKIMGLSDCVAGIMINVARKSKQIPALRAALKNKQVTASKVHKFCSAVNEANAPDWIEYSSSHTAREIEDRVQAQDPNRAKSHKFKLSLHAEKLLKRAQSLESQRQSRPVSKEEILEIALEFFVERKDPVKRADRVLQRAKAKNKDGRTQNVKVKSTDGFSQRARAKKNIAENAFIISDAQPFTGNTQQFTGTIRKLKRPESSPTRVPFTADQRNAVMARTRGCCTYVNAGGERCSEDRWIDIHHIKPVRNGGTNDIENLTVLCGFHHDLLHQLELPLENESPSRMGRISSSAMHS